MVTAAVLIPVKDFRQAKARLAFAVSPSQRHRLARWTATRVVAAAAPFDVFVACDDPEVATWAQDQGTTVLWLPAMGLNAAVAAGVQALVEHGFEHVIIAHSDLPLATSFANLVIPDSVTLVPDVRRDGTNVMVLPSRGGIEPSYGSQSFHRHLAQAQALGLPVQVVDDDALSLDIDTPADLAHPRIAKELPSWLQMNQDSHRSRLPSGQTT